MEPSLRERPKTQKLKVSKMQQRAYPARSRPRNGQNPWANLPRAADRVAAVTHHPESDDRLNQRACENRFTFQRLRREVAEFGHHKQCPRRLSNRACEPRFTLQRRHCEVTEFGQHEDCHREMILHLSTFHRSIGGSRSHHRKDENTEAQPRHEARQRDLCNTNEECALGDGCLGCVILKLEPKWLLKWWLCDVV